MRLRNLEKAQKLEEEVMACGGQLQGDKIRIVQRTGTKFTRKVYWLEPCPLDPTNGMLEGYLELDLLNKHGLGQISIHIRHADNSGNVYFGSTEFFLKTKASSEDGWLNLFHNLLRKARDGGYRALGIPEDFSDISISRIWENETWETWGSAVKRTMLKEESNGL